MRIHFLPVMDPNPPVFHLNLQENLEEFELYLQFLRSFRSIQTQLNIWEQQENPSLPGNTRDRHFPDRIPFSLEVGSPLGAAPSLSPSPAGGARGGHGGVPMLECPCATHWGQQQGGAGSGIPQPLAMGALSPHLHHLLADVDDAEPVQELGEALEFGIALLQGHLPLAGQLPAEILHQLALEKKAKPSWDPPQRHLGLSSRPAPSQKFCPKTPLVIPAAKSVEVWCPRGNFPPKKSLYRPLQPQPSAGVSFRGCQPSVPPGDRGDTKLPHPGAAQHFSLFYSRPQGQGTPKGHNPPSLTPRFGAKDPQNPPKATLPSRTPHKNPKGGSARTLHPKAGTWHFLLIPLSPTQNFFPPEPFPLSAPLYPHFCSDHPPQDPKSSHPEAGAVPSLSPAAPKNKSAKRAPALLSRECRAGLGSCWDFLLPLFQLGDSPAALDGAEPLLTPKTDP